MSLARMEELAELEQQATLVFKAEREAQEPLVFKDLKATRVLLVSLAERVVLASLDRKETPAQLEILVCKVEQVALELPA